ncbi:hypothetical protein UlMin_036317 [Ulmus minor]
MARQLLSSSTDNSQSNAFQVGTASMSLFLFAMAVFMCASHSHRARRWRACYEPDFDDDDIYPTIEHVQAGNNVENVDVDEQGMSVWQKNILMGGKCQLPDFSGVIIYDGDGNVVTPAKTSRYLLPWK